MELLKPYNYYFELPLYSKIKFDVKIEEDKIFELFWHLKGIDAYNPTIKENTTYFIVQPRDKNYNLYTLDGLNVTSLKCSRTGDFIYVASYLDSFSGIIQKIGQYPSIAHFHISKIKEYDKILENDKLKEFTRAIGLASNGVGIGSFVYLRRIFEHLLDREHQRAKSNQGWNDELYLKSKVVDRIELLKDYLPNFLVENKSLYGILSVGIHSLNEKECLAYFEIVKDGIELILDEELERFKKEQKVKEAKKKIATINQQIKEQKKQ